MASDTEREDSLTLEQRYARDTRGRNLIVSAAAGSGKTTVLSKRVVKYIESGGSFDRLLIVTFTKASNADMRAKIASAVRKQYEKTGDPHLKRESLRAAQAEISTIDSFQTRVVREYFREAGVTPNFSVMDESEQGYCEEKVLSDLLDGYYESRSEDFENVLKLFGGNDENDAVADAIRGTFDFMKSVPFADRWLEKTVALYDTPEVWAQAALAELQPQFEEILGVYREAIDREFFGTEKAVECVKSECEALSLLCEACRAGDLEALAHGAAAMRDLFNEHKNKLKCASGDHEQKRLTYFRSLLKKIIEMKLLNPAVLTNLQKDLDALRPGIRSFARIVSVYADRVREAYRRENRYSFDEISSMALRIVAADPDSEWVVASPAGEELRSRYDEIMIDEYQDVNDRQDLFFRILSDDNLFIVGDVKQSIYGFRRANPDNFIRKMSEFTPARLTKNFRSRKGVLSICNYVFERVFSPGMGGIRYDETQRLAFGAPDFPDSPTPDAEVDFLLHKGRGGVNGHEADFIARRIKELVASGMTVYPPKSEPRPVRYGDIAVLMRVGTGFPEYRDAFVRHGVPVYAPSGLTFFDTPEVGVLLGLLRVLDNPYSDMELFGVMTSWLFGFTPEEVASVRLTKKGCRLYAALKEHAKTNEKSRAFLEELSHLRLLANDLPLHRLIRYLYVSRDYPARVSYCEDGASRRDNLMRFYRFAVRYGEIANGSVSDFLAFVERARKSRSKETEASVPQGNFVRMMTIHASKGLEFPVCFLAGMEGSGGGGFHPPVIQYDDTLGFGTFIRNDTMDEERPTTMREIITLRSDRREKEEELRLLYVAMTRAKEKLFLVSTVSQTAVDGAMDYYAACDGTRVSPTALRYASCFRDVVWMALSHHGCMDVMDGMAGGTAVPSDEPVTFRFIEDEAGDASANPTLPPVVTGLSPEEIRRRFTFRYPNPLSHIPAGLSVTELVKHRDTDPSCEILCDDLPSDEPPAFMQDGTLSGARRGSALHTFCEQADLDKDIGAEKARLVAEKRLTAEEAASIREDKVRAFTQSDLYRRLKTALRVRREEPFLIAVPATLYDKNAGEGRILLQGAMDAVYEFEDSVTVLDYKSDRCDEAELLARYARQISLYALAARRLYGKPVRQAVIWSFSLGREINVPLDTDADS